jgi:predicted nucleic acid-binding protein
MSVAPERYALDANAFIQAKRKFYAFDFCPGYWRTLIWHQRQGRLCSIDKVRAELRKGADDLWSWAENQFGEAAFASTSDPAVTAIYGQMLAWVMAQTQFNDPAKAEFQQVADGWLAAYAKVNGSIVVTLEEFDPVIKKKVPLPNVCRAFDVEPITPFEMLRRLNVRLTWQPPA